MENTYNTVYECNQWIEQNEVVQQALITEKSESSWMEQLKEKIICFFHPRPNPGLL